MLRIVRRVVCSLCLFALPVASFPSAARAADPLAEAQDRYERGAAKFETADYEGAIALWTDAYSMVPATPENTEIKVLLLYNLATAREKAFEVDGKVSHLRQALILLDGFASSVTALYGEGEEGKAEAARVAERRAAILARIEAAEGRPGEGPGEGPAGPDPAEVEARRGRTLTIAGAALLGAGGLALGLMGAGLGMGAAANDVSGLDPDDVSGRRDQFERGRLGNTLAIAGGAAAGPLVIVGAALLGVGMKKSRRAQAAAAPALGRGFVGVSVRGRF